MSPESEQPRSILGRLFGGVLGWLRGLPSTLANALVVTLVLGLIGGGAAAVIVTRGGGSSKTTPTRVMKPPPDPTTASPTPPPPTACLPSSSSSDAQDGSLSSAQGPLRSGKVYRGDLVSRDVDWRGFCVGHDAAVTVTFTNVCTEPDGSGATNLIAGVTDQHGDELTSLRPDPGKNMDYPFLAKAHTPYYVDIHDLGDIDLGSGNVCPRAPWSLVVTGPLVANWPSGG